MILSGNFLPKYSPRIKQESPQTFGAGFFDTHKYILSFGSKIKYESTQVRCLVFTLQCNVHLLLSPVNHGSEVTD